MKAYWGILQKPYRSERSSLEVLARIVVCLTNLKLREAPLFADEDVYNPCPSVSEEEEETGATQSPQVLQQVGTPTTRTTRCKRRRQSRSEE